MYRNMSNILDKYELKQLTLFLLMQIFNILIGIRLRYKNID
jgi:hypothetical protein